MLILVGTVPTAYALNHAVSPSQTADFLLCWFSVNWRRSVIR
jgi:hypothetical protein